MLGVRLRKLSERVREGTLAVVLAAACLPAMAQMLPVRATGNGGDLLARLRAAEQDAGLGARLIKTGQQVAAFCAHCHGAGGNSVNPAIPNLAGQNPEYLIEQLRLFADGQRRNEFMEGMIRALKPDEKVGMVLFYAGEKVVTQAPGNPALMARGREYYKQVCANCHGQDGHGSAQFARIAGQQPDYLRTTLRHYRDGEKSRSSSLMRSYTQKMTDTDIDAVVAFVASLP